MLRFPHWTTVSAVMRLAVLVAAFSLFAADADAQQRASLVAGIRAPASTFSPGATTRSTENEASGSGHAVGMANGALIGAGIGIAVGLLASPIVNAQNADHSEDSMTYIVLPAFGAFLGLIVGGLVGWRRGS